MGHSTEATSGKCIEPSQELKKVGRLAKSRNPQKEEIMTSYKDHGTEIEVNTGHVKLRNE